MDDETIIVMQRVGPEASAIGHTSFIDVPSASSCSPSPSRELSSRKPGSPGDWFKA